MKPVTVAITIEAAPDLVYQTIVDIERLPQTSPDTISVRFVGSQHSGAGTRFVETRTGGGRSQEFELELTECDPRARTARFVSDMDDTVWDTTMRVTPEPMGCHVQFSMEARTSSKIKRLVFTMMRGVFRRAMNKQVVALKRYCEST